MAEPEAEFDPLQYDCVHCGDGTVIFRCPDCLGGRLYKRTLRVADDGSDCLDSWEVEEGLGPCGLCYGTGGRCPHCGRYGAPGGHMAGGLKWQSEIIVRKFRGEKNGQQPYETRRVLICDDKIVSDEILGK